MDRETINQFIEKEKYSLTIKEWNYIKKQVKEILAPYDIEPKFHKEHKNLNITLYAPLEMSNYTSALLSGMEDNYPNVGRGEELDQLCKKIEDLVSRHQVCYSERDLMTSYYGLYRISFFVQARYKREELDRFYSCLNELREIHEANGHGRNTLDHKLYNEIAGRYNLPRI